MITSETFYQASCDANGCDRMFPDGDEWDGASHLPLDDLRKYMAEERGEHDERWTTVGDADYCPRHTPGNIDCTTCGGDGMVMDNPEGATFVERGWRKCDRCDSRGYLIPVTPPTAGRTE